MIKNSILMVLGLFLLASCETTSSSGDSAGGSVADSYASGESSTASLQDYLKKEVGDSVYFETDKHNISASAAFKLEAQANWINSTPGFTIIIEGHCDERGTREYNLALGERRANSVKDFLVSMGVESGRIQTISYGKERPVNSGVTSEAYAENRRVVTVVGD
tara:strand:+ start:218 stop:706 length:489 start_codon:yes stop_codon:yes gene_type:complete